jgi:hypothetical protein
MTISCTILKTIDNPIPVWKGVDDLPDILTISGEAPPISGANDTIIDFHCAETFSRDMGIMDSDADPAVYKYELVENTKYDDQS